jgi:hypothetical protein
MRHGGGTRSCGHLRYCPNGVSRSRLPWRAWARIVSRGGVADGGERLARGEHRVDCGGKEHVRAFHRHRGRASQWRGVTFCRRGETGGGVLHHEMWTPQYKYIE